MKNFKTLDEQLEMLKKKNIFVNSDEETKEFLSKENYYNIINGYKDLFLLKDECKKVKTPEEFIDDTNFEHLKCIFLFDRELRSIFLKYLLIFENQFKTILSYEFSKKYPEKDSYLERDNFYDDKKEVLNVFVTLARILKEKMEENGPVKHYMNKHKYVPLWVFINYLTLGNVSHFYKILKPEDKEIICRRLSENYNKNYKPTTNFKMEDTILVWGIRILNIIRNVCAHDERLYNIKFKNTYAARLENYFGFKYLNNYKLIASIVYLKFFLPKAYFGKFYNELFSLLNNFKNKLPEQIIKEIIKEMGINIEDLLKLK